MIAKLRNVLDLTVPYAGSSRDRGPNASSILLNTVNDTRPHPAVDFQPDDPDPP
jgi:hypothetical protein